MTGVVLISTSKVHVLKIYSVYLMLTKLELMEVDICNLIELA